MPHCRALRFQLPRWVRADVLGVSGRVAMAVVAAAFVVYQALLPLTTARHYPDFWHFGADSYRISVEKLGRHPMAKYQTGKHPLYVVIAAPLYHAGRAVYSRVAPEPLAENLALTFPVAVLGAANAGVALLLFRCVGFAIGPALLLLLLYAGSAAIVVFSTFPDSYICTTLFTNLFLLAWLHDRELEHWLLLAVATALAGFAAPQQMLPTLVPAAALLAGGRSRGDVAPVLKYAAAAVAFFAGPYVAQLAVFTSGDVAGFVDHETSKWSSLANLLNAQLWASVLVVFVGVALMVSVPATALEAVTLAELATHAGVWLSFAGVLAYGTIGHVWCRRLAGHAREMCLGLVAFLAAYLAFFVWWTPTEAFIYSAPFLMPLWLLLHAPWVDMQHRAGWRAAVAAAALAVAAHSVWTVATLPERHDYRRVLSKWEPPPAFVRPPMA
jgi:hypothetical protein